MSPSLPLTGLNSACVVISFHFLFLQVYLLASLLPDCFTDCLLPDASVASLDDKEDDDASGRDGDASLPLLVLDGWLMFAGMYSPPWLAEDTGYDDDTTALQCL